MKRLALLLTLLIPVFTFSQIINIPDDYPTIQEGIDAAVNSDTVLVDTGTYVENINYKGKAITVASKYILYPDSTYINNTIIDGSQPSENDSACVVLFMNNEDTTSVLCGFTITGGTGCYWKQHPLFEKMKGGGGIQMIECGGKIINNIITNNHVVNEWEAFGGGIQGADLPDSNMIIVEDNLFYNNSVNGKLWAKGGGMAIAFCHARIRNNIVRNNTVTGDSIRSSCSAGGVWYSNGTTYVANVDISGNIIIENKVNTIDSTAIDTWAGGMAVVAYYSNIDIKICENTIADNTIEAYNLSFGSGLLVNRCDSVKIIGNKIWGNSSNASQSYGGGMCIWNSHPYIINNLIFDNNSKFGGGMYVGQQTRSQSRVYNNTIWSNHGNIGGGVYLYNSLVELGNNIIWENVADQYPSIYQQVTQDNIVSYSNIEGGWNGVGTDNIDQDPLFVMVGNHPCQINDYSPCIDAGTPDTTGLNLPEYDLAGEIRLVNERVDMGAYEWNWMVGIEDTSLPEQKQLQVNNYPNPFSTSTTIEYELTHPETVRITFYNQFGKQVDVIEERQQSGLNRIKWTPENLADGIYYFRFEAGGQVTSGKVVLMK